MVAANSATAIKEKWFGPGGPLHNKQLRKERRAEKMAKAAEKKEPVEKIAKIGRKELLAKAKSLGIKWFNAFTKVELEEAIKPETSVEQITKLSEKAKKRWLSKIKKG